MRSIRKRAPFLLACGPLVLWILGLILLFGVPFIEQRRNVHDESNLRNAFANSIVVSNGLIRPTANTTVPRHLIVHGKRSSGTESFLILNCGPSTSVALTLAAALKNQAYYSMDIHFYFLETCSESQDVNLPQGLIRGGLLLDFDSEATGDVCVHTYGRGGLQPNQDLVNTVVAAFRARGFSCSFLCSPTTRGLYWRLVERVSSFLPPHLADQLLHFKTYLVSMVTDHQGAVGGGSLRSSKGLFIVGVSSKMKSSVGAHRPELDYAVAVEYVLRSFNNLNERLHHSCPIWVSLSPDVFVDFQLVQLVPFLFIGSGVVGIFKTFEELKNEGMGGFGWHVAIPTLLLLLPIPSLEGGLVSATLSFLVAKRMRASKACQLLVLQMWVVVWMTLFLALHPALSVLGNALLSFQLLFLFPKKRLHVLIGTITSMSLAIILLREILPVSSENEKDTAIRSFIFTSALLMVSSGLGLVSCK